MRERLLNPKILKINLEALKIIIIDNVSYRTFTEKFTKIDDGRCQCYHDCDCSSRKGEVTNIKINWYRNIKFDGTDKCFYSEPYTQKEYLIT